MTQPQRRDRLGLGILALVGPTGVVLLDGVVAAARGWPHLSRLDLLVLAPAAMLAATAVLLLVLPSGRRFVRTRWAHLLALSVSACATLAVAEVGLRLALAPPGVRHRHDPNLKKVFHPAAGTMPGISGDSHFTTNSLGIRGDEFPPREPAYRILCIGGSATECLYLDDDETWPRLLMTHLNARPDGRRVWVGNAGHMAYTSLEHVQFVQHSELLAQIDCLVVLMGFNDFQQHLERRRAVPLWTRSRVLKLIQMAWYRVAEPMDVWVEDSAGKGYPLRRQRRRGAMISEVLPDLERPLRDYEARIRSITALCRKKGVRPVFATQPVLWTESPSPAAESLLWFGWMEDGRYLSVRCLRQGMDRFNERLRTTCREIGADYIDLAGLNGRVEFFYDDVHFNEAGAREVARRIADWFAQHPQ